MVKLPDVHRACISVDGHKFDVEENCFAPLRFIFGRMQEILSINGKHVVHIKILNSSLLHIWLALYIYF